MFTGSNSRKLAAVFVAVFLLLNAVVSVPVASAATPETIAAWNYAAAPTAAAVPATSGTSSAAVLTNFKNITPTYSSSSLSITGWDNGSGTKYWQLSLSTKDYENLYISAQTRSSGTGPRDFKIVYSTDNGANWADIPNSSYTIVPSTLQNISSEPITIPADASGANSLLIRFIMTSNISARAGTGTYSATETVASGGTSNINSIVITGTPIQNTSAVGAVTAVPEGGAVALDSKVALTCETDGAAILYSINDSEYVQYDPDTQITLSALPAVIKAYGTKTGMTDGAASTFSYTQGQAEPVIATPNGGLVPLNSQVALSCGTPGASIKYSLDDGANWNDYSIPITLEALPVTIKAYAAAEGMLNSAPASFSFNQKSEGAYNIYFGQLHSHTTISDGIGSLDDAYGHAKNVAKVDFLAITDHSNSFDNASTSSMADGSKSTEWVAGHAAADMYTDSNFVGIYAYEMTWSNGTGHINTFNTPGFENRETQIYKNADGLRQYYNVLKQYPDSISQLNHPGTTFGDFNDFANYDPIIDQRISLIEVGNGEGAVGSNLYFPSYEYYTRALDKGWHVSPTNNQDNHLGLWGDANTARTVVLADTLTRDNIYDAMRNMRTYATEDNNLRIKYTLNGEIMGTVLAQEPGSVNIKVDLEDPDNEALGEVSVISNGGKVVASETLTSSKDTVEFNLAPDYSYYYIRVDEADKDIAVTAPVWIGEVDKAGIAKTVGSTSLPVKGEKFTVTTSMFNNEDAPMNITSLEYSINGSVINTAPPISPVASLGTGSYSFDYTPDAAGKYNVDVKLIAIINGVEKIFNDVLTLEVVDPAVTTKIVVDASNYNDYVSGYYAGNMTNLVTLANAEGMNVVIQKDKLTNEVLRDAQLLILSPPAKKAGTANGIAYPISSYSDDEIAVIKNFADKGGNIIVTALADYQDSRTNPAIHSAYQQNLILAAIGAGSRINDDEVVDYDNNPNVTPPGVAGGTPYRVPMNVYNMASPYLSGIVSSQNYSFYSGCSITMGSDATWLVKGTPTTYGFDSDNDGLGGSYVSAANKTIPADTGIGKGNVVALATETLPGGGKLFIAGTVFYSNFEIKVQLDNPMQPQNSNYNITMNILDSVKKVIPLTQIGIARSGQTGDLYCVEGTVTAGTTPADNAFFDTIYIQDDTGGINIFPVSGMDIMVGQKVRVTGTLDQYQGDKELRTIEISVTDTAVNPITPTTLTTAGAMDSVNGGMLVAIEGTVTKMDTQNLYIDDGSGEARVFVDGYIGDGSGDDSKLGKWDPMIQVGDKVNAIGLASVDTAGPRLRVRNTAEIVRIKDTIAPVVTITGVEDGGCYNTEVTPAVSADEGTLTTTLNGQTYNGETITAEGDYTLEATAADRDENKTTQKVTFAIDKTPPEIAVTGVEDEGLYNTPVTPVINITDSHPGTTDVTLNDQPYSGSAVTADGSYTLKVTSTDKAGNKSEASLSFMVDQTAPVISVLGIKDGEMVMLNQKITVTWECSDAPSGSGIASSSGDIVSGADLDTSKSGPHTLTFTATDKAGNTATLVIAYNVQYAFSGFLSPIKEDGKKEFKQGSTIAVKFWLKDSNGSYVTDVNAKLYIAKITDGIAGTEFKAVSTSAASNDNNFRYSNEDKQYIFNLYTKDLEAGAYQIRVDLGDGSTNVIILNLK